MVVVCRCVDALIVCMCCLMCCDVVGFASLRWHRPSVVRPSSVLWNEGIIPIQFSTCIVTFTCMLTLDLCLRLPLSSEPSSHSPNTPATIPRSIQSIRSDSIHSFSAAPAPVSRHPQARFLTLPGSQASSIEYHSDRDSSLQGILKVPHSSWISASSIEHRASFRPRSIHSIRLLIPTAVPAPGLKVSLKVSLLSSAFISISM